MNIQEKIIALLQGDLKDDSQVTELIDQLAAVSEHRRFLLEHIALSQQLDRLVGNLVPTTAAKIGVLSRIEAFERGGDSFGTATEGKSERSGWRSQLVWSAIFCALLIGLGLGYWFGDRKNATTHMSIHHRGSLEPINPVAVPDRRQEKIAAVSKNSAIPPLPVSPFMPDLAVHHTWPQNMIGQADSNETDSIKILFPNGGEHFKAGSVIPVTWSGKFDNRFPTTVEYSTDGGTSWGEINKIQEGKKIWWRIPDVKTATQCLARIIVEDTVGLEPIYERTFLGHDSGVAVAEISPDGRFLATVGVDTKVLIWNMQTGELVRTMMGHTNYVTFAKFSHDGKKLASCSQDGTVRIWDIETGKEDHILPGKGQGKNLVWAVAFSPDNRIVAVTNDDGTFTMWDLETGSEFAPAGLGDTFQPHDESVRYIEFTPDGTRLIASSTDGTASIIDVKTGQVLHRFEHHIDNPLELLGVKATKSELVEALRRRIVNGVQMVPDGSTLITCGFDGLVKFWDIETGTLIRSDNYHNGAKISSITLSSDGKLLASASYDGTTKIIDVASGIVLATITLPLNGKSASMIRASFAKDMRLLAIAHRDGRATLWRLKPIIHSDISDSFWSIEPCGVAEPELN